MRGRLQTPEWSRPPCCSWSTCWCLAAGWRFRRWRSCRGQTRCSLRGWMATLRCSGWQWVAHGAVVLTQEGCVPSWLGPRSRGRGRLRAGVPCAASRCHSSSRHKAHAQYVWRASALIILHRNSPSTACRRCWAQAPAERPTFEQVIPELRALRTLATQHKGRAGHGRSGSSPLPATPVAGTPTGSDPAVALGAAPFAAGQPTTPGGSAE